MLVHPALHEAFGNVCLEAMAAGKPVICLDLGGPAMQVTERTAFSVPADSVAGAVRGMADALAQLADCPKLRAEIGMAAVTRVQEKFSWPNKGEWMAEVYRACFLDRPRLRYNTAATHAWFRTMVSDRAGSTTR